MERRYVRRLLEIWHVWPHGDEIGLCQRLRSYARRADWELLNYRMTQRLNERGFAFDSVFHNYAALEEWFAIAGRTLYPPRRQERRNNAICNMRNIL